jgi:serine/threonine protein kinase
MIKQQLIHSSYQPLANEIERYFAQSNTLLQDDRNTIKEVVFNNEILVVKSYKQPNWLRGFIYTYFKKTKAWRAYQYGLKIAKFTPSVIARIENFQPLLRKSYLICQKFEADFDIRSPLLDKSFNDRKQIFKQFSGFVYQLHQNNILHNDLSPGNILIKKNQQNYEFKIIDINRMHFKALSIKDKAKNFNKLWADDDDLALILQTYAKLSGKKVDYFVNLGLGYNQQNKAKKIRKRKIKQALGL